MADTSYRITADTSAFVAEVQRARDSLGGLQNVADKTKGAFEALGVGLSVAAFVELGKKAVDAGVQLQLLSEKSGISVDKLSELKFAGQLTGVGIDSLATGLKKLSVNMNETAATGTGKAAEAFEAMGISVKDVSGNLKSNEAVMGEIADKFHGMEDGAGKTALAVATMGRSGDQLIPTLNKGQDAIRAMGDEAKALGITIGPEFARSAKEFDDNLIKLQNTTAKRFAAAVLPDLNALMGAMVEGVKISGSFSESLRLFSFNLDAMTTEKPAEEIRRLTKALDDYRVASALGKFAQSPTGTIFGGREEDLQKQIEYLKALQREEALALTAGARGRMDSKDLGPTILAKAPIFGGDSAGNADRESSWLSSLQDKLNAASGDMSEFSKVMNAIATGSAKNFSDATKIGGLALAGESDELREVSKQSKLASEDIDEIIRVQAEATRSTETFALKQQQSIDAIKAKTAELGMSPQDAAKAAAMHAIGKGFETEILKITQDLNKIGDNDGIKIMKADMLAAAEVAKGKMGDALDADKAKFDALNASWEYGVDTALRNYMDEVNNVAKATDTAVTNTFHGMEDVLVEFGMTGKANFSNFANSIIRDMLRIEAQANITGPLSRAMKDAGGLGGIWASLTGQGTGAGMSSAGMAAYDIGNYSAKGNVFSSPDLHQYVNTIGSSPTLFKFAQGGAFGMMREAGPEAVMPLTRDASGRLGVDAQGAGGMPNIVVQVINQSGQQVTAKQQGPGRMDGDRYIIGVVLEAADSNPAFRSAFGIGA